MQMATRIGSDSFTAPPAPKFHDEVDALWRVLTDTDEAIRTQKEELEALARELDENSRIDPLTRVHNRHHLYLEAPKLFALAGRKQQPVCLMMIDVDYFKRVNDTYGHKVGDDALKLIAATIGRAVREYDLFVRFGGEEFMLIMGEGGQGQYTAERIRHSVETAVLHLDDGRSLTLRVSIGLCCAPGLTLEQAVLRADSALYRAKNSGRNRVCVDGDDAQPT